MPQPTAMTLNPPAPPFSVRLGSIRADALSMAQAIDAVEAMLVSGGGGYVVTPNVDHVVLAHKNRAFRAAYANASLSLVDGMPLLWLSRLMGYPLPEKVSGSDLIRPLVRRASAIGSRVYLLGAAPGVAAIAARRLMREIPAARIVGIASPPYGFDTNEEQESATFETMQAADPDLVLIALGAPKQELLMHRWYERGVKQVMVGIGAGLDFIAGAVKRAPRWMSNAGMEWLFRLYRDPRRLAGRYLVRDLRIVQITYRMLALPRDARICSDHISEGASTVVLPGQSASAE